MQQFTIKKTDTFDVRQTLECGQVFRFREEGEKFVLHALSHRAEIALLGDNYVIDCDDAAFFQKYLDFDTNYDIIQLKSQDKEFVSSAIEFGKGIHLLKQDVVETLFSFLISQNNHIPRIKAIIERLCVALGEDMGSYYAFPTVEAFASKNAEWYHLQGLGYRAEYIASAAVRLLEEGLPDFDKLTTDKCRKLFLDYKGIGRKVADCILLFGLQRYDVFPVDTWIMKMFAERYPNLSAEKLSEVLVNNYGEYSGFVQQWLFYFKREEKKSRQIVTYNIE